MRHCRYHAATFLLMSKTSLSLRMLSSRLISTIKPTIQYVQNELSFLPTVIVTSPPSQHPIWHHEEDELNTLPYEERPSLFCEYDMEKPKTVSVPIEGGFARYSATTPDLSDMEPQCIEAVQVIYSDGDILVLDKPAELLSVPGAFSRFSLASATAHLYGYDRVDRIIVHRLDRSTSGVMIIAKNLGAQRALQKQFRDRTTRKRYIAIASGSMSKEEGEITYPLSRHPTGPSPYQCVNTREGKSSHTDWKIISRDSFQTAPAPSPPLRVTRLELMPFTGRSHQLRVHMAAIGHPLLGDSLYGLPLEIHERCSPKERQRLYLHAESISIEHPVTGANMTFTAECPF